MAIIYIVSLLFLEKNGKVLLGKGLEKKIKEWYDKFIDDKDACENLSVVVFAMLKATGFVICIKHFFNEIGSFDIILKVLEKNVSSKVVSESLIGFIGFFLINKENSVLNKVKIPQKNLVKVLNVVMEMHKDSKEIAPSCVRIIGNILYEQNTGLTEEESISFLTLLDMNWKVFKEVVEIHKENDFIQQLLGGLLAKNVGNEN